LIGRNLKHHQDISAIWIPGWRNQGGKGSHRLISQMKRCLMLCHFHQKSDWTAGDLQKNPIWNDQITSQFNQEFIAADPLTSALLWVHVSAENVRRMITHDGWFLCFSGPPGEKRTFRRMQSSISGSHPGMDHFIRPEMRDEAMIQEKMFRHCIQLIFRKSRCVEGRNASSWRSLVRPSEIADIGEPASWKCDMMQLHHSDKDLCNSNADQGIARLNHPMNLQIPTTL
jgi:hypothetical protein